jgi:hypothetical protein
MRARSPFRALRAAAFAAVCVALALAGHAAVSGGTVPLWAWAMATVGIAGAAWAGAGRERGPAAIGGALVTAQAGLHLLFSWARTPGGPRPPTRGRLDALWLQALLCNADAAPPAASSRYSAADLLARMGLDPALTARPPAQSGIAAFASARTGHHSGGAPAAAADHAGGIAGLIGHGGPAMLAAHLAVACATALWLWRGERAAFRLSRVLATAAARTLLRALGPFVTWAGGPSTGPRVRMFGRAPAHAAMSQWTAGAVRLRGPPPRVRAA